MERDKRDRGFSSYFTFRLKIYPQPVKVNPFRWNFSLRPRLTYARSDYDLWMKHARLNFVSTVEKHRFFLTELKKKTRSIVIRSATSAFLLGFTNCRKQRAPSRCFTTSLNPFFLCLVFLLSVSAVISWKFNILPKISSFPPPFFSPKHKWRRRRRSYRLNSTGKVGDDERVYEGTKTFNV